MTSNFTPATADAASNRDSWLARFSRRATYWSGTSTAFGIAALTIIVWLATGPLFRFSDTWQLVINTGTTIVTFLMVFLIQRAQNKDSRAVHLKLNELVAAMRGASNRLINVEELTEAEVKVLHEHYCALVELAKADTQPTESHSVEDGDGAPQGEDEGRLAAPPRIATRPRGHPDRQALRRPLARPAGIRFRGVDHPGIVRVVELLAAGGAALVDREAFGAADRVFGGLGRERGRTSLGEDIFAPRIELHESEAGDVGWGGGFGRRGLQFHRALPVRCESAERFAKVVPRRRGEPFSIVDPRYWSCLHSLSRHNQRGLPTWNDQRRFGKSCAMRVPNGSNTTRPGWPRRSPFIRSCRWPRC